MRVVATHASVIDLSCLRVDGDDAIMLVAAYLSVADAENIYLHAMHLHSRGEHEAIAYGDDNNKSHDRCRNTAR
jgi:hypothetical protein